MNHLDLAGSKKDLLINVDNTKTMVQGNQLEQVSTLSNLGSLITKDSESDKEIPS